MATSKKSQTVAQYLAALPPDRKKAIAAVRRTIRAHLPQGIRETINWGMICYEVPLATFAETYNGRPLMYAALAAQKAHLAVYLTCMYTDKKVEKALRAKFEAEGKKLDMGKSCIRFKKLEDLSLEAIGDAIASMTLKEYVALHEKVHGRR